TGAVYRRGAPPDPPRPRGPVLEALASGDVAALGRTLFNRLQAVAEAICPDLVPVRRALETLGPSLDGSLMSGSGAAYFGLGRDLDAVRKAARALETTGQGQVRVVTCGP
ncbi:MAG: 4-(cytidine 5'-diphospho)-2-C-methyl-D-erythritol kinase, partial [Isosphaeraceae bacterium]|nr:4-(cytidine 5'-diphospho)-2-C-methyl-D-erythritol kinase [Isosphaeraceae bacterium]